MMRYLMTVLLLLTLQGLYAQKNIDSTATLITFAAGWSQHIKHELPGMAIEVNGKKPLKGKWYWHYGGGFQQYAKTDKQLGEFLARYDGSGMLFPENETAPLRIQTAGIQLQTGLTYQLKKHLGWGAGIVGRYQGTSKPESYTVVNNGTILIEPAYRIDSSPVQEWTYGGNMFVTLGFSKQPWWMPGLKMLIQTDNKQNTLLHLQLHWDGLNPLRQK
jgi:hypothetical protein